MRALLWDLDGTLLSTGRAGVIALEDAAREVVGTEPDLSSLATSGLTDAAVAALAIEATGGDVNAETVARFLAIYESNLPARLPLRKGQVLPNVREILDHLHGHADCFSLLLTGNTRLGAAAKLKHYDLEAYFDDGAFCVDDGPRTGIAARAQELVEGRLGRPSRAEEVYVIGDTPHDIDAGNAIEARTIAVATGTHSLEELVACEPWAALDTLPSPDKFLMLLGVR